MSNLLKHMWFELRHNPVFWVTLTVCFTFMLFLTGTVVMSFSTDPSVPTSAACDWLNLFKNSATEGILPLITISGTSVVLMFGQKFSSRTINQEITAGHSRGEIFASLCIVGFVVLSSTVLLSVIAGCLCWAGKFPMPSAEIAIPYFLRILFLLPILSFSFFSACMIFVVCFRDTAKATVFSACFLFTAVILMAVTLTAILKPYLAATPGAFGSVVSAPPLSLFLQPTFLIWYVLYSTLAPAQGIQAAGVAIGWTALFLSIAYCVFRRCELK